MIFSHTTLNTGEIKEEKSKKIQERKAEEGVLESF